MPDLRLPAGCRQVTQSLLDVLWAVAMLSLPFTSFPLLVNLTGAIVAPLAAIPIFLLVLFWLIPYLLRQRALPGETIPLVIFALVVLLACSLAFFYDIPGYKGRTIFGQELRALVTFVIGLAFLLTTASWPQTETRLRRTLLWINIGGILAIFWTSLQAYFFFADVGQFPAWYEHIMEWFVVRSASFNAPNPRVTGLTYEPSWFAHQMVMLYIPLWIAASYYRTSAFRKRFFGISAENVLLVLGVGLFFLTSPRIGLISFFLIGVFLFVKLNLAILRRLVNFITSRPRFQGNRKHVALRILVTGITTLVLVTVYSAALAASIYFISQRDWRFALLVTEPPSWQEILAILSLDEAALLSLAHRLAFMERVVYWFTGWHVFNDHPLLGVGLGNTGFFTLEKAPAIGWASYEIRALFFRLPQLPNIKSFWVRLLAETGLVGFSVFISWLVLLFRSARLTLRSQQPLLQTLALTGQLSLVAFIGEGFSIDSFAMPYLWVTLGLIIAASWYYRQHS